MKSPITTSLLTYASTLMQEQLVTLKELPTKPDESERLSLLLNIAWVSYKIGL